ncbi:MAG: thioredoxin family protein [Bacteroidales bacterium]
MKKLKLFFNAKHGLSILFLLFSVLFIAALFALKGKLTELTSKSIKAQVNAGTRQSASILIDSLYNYKRNGLKNEITFLEFGATGCSACKQMEAVMAQIKRDYPNRVNVVFVNILKKDNQLLMKYFGISLIPNQVLLNSEGKEFFRHTGHLAAEELAKEFNLD